MAGGRPQRDRGTWFGVTVIVWVVLAVAPALSVTVQLGGVGARHRVGVQVAAPLPASEPLPKFHEGRVIVPSPVENRR